MPSPTPPHFSQCTQTQATKFIAPILGLIIGCVGVLHACAVRAESPQTAPPQVKNTLAQIDAAANSQNIQGVLQFYSPNFSDSDGLNRQSLQQALTQLWQRYPKLTYRTELKSWQSEGNAIVAETVTYINGVQSKDGKNMKLDSTLRSRQRFEGQQIVKQEVLAERTLVTSGAKPPTVDFQLPDRLRSGQDYDLDAVVKEPLGDDLLLGSAVEEPVNAERYLKPAPLQLEPLQSGGIFKSGKAPAKQGNYWVSAVLVRADGMTMITQRLQVVDGK